MFPLIVFIVIIIIVVVSLTQTGVIGNPSSTEVASPPVLLAKQEPQFYHVTVHFQALVVVWGDILKEDEYYIDHGNEDSPFHLQVGESASLGNGTIDVTLQSVEAGQAKLQVHTTIHCCDNTFDNVDCVVNKGWGWWSPVQTCDCPGQRIWYDQQVRAQVEEFSDE